MNEQYTDGDIMVLKANEEKANFAEKIVEALKGKTEDHEKVATLTRNIIRQNNGKTFQSNEYDTILQLTLQAYDYLKNRPPHAHKIRAYDLTIKKSEAIKDTTITVIEILNDDMPFLVDSIMGEIQERQLEVHNVIHPILQVKRDEEDNLIEIAEHSNEKKNGAAENNEANKESFIQIQTEPLSDEQKRDLVKSISDILESVRMAVADWHAMRTKIAEAVSSYTESPPSVDVVNLAESVQFLKWLLNDHFLILGVREYSLTEKGEDKDLLPIDGSGLGILRDKEVRVLRRNDQIVHLPEEIREFFFSPEPLIITKANARSQVHRRVHMDYIGVKIFSTKGEICGELRIVGLFTSTAYTRQPRDIPFIRHKVDTVVKRYGHSTKSHSTKALINVLENFPRDELFQISAERLYEVTIGIHELDLQPRPKVFTRIDEFHRFVSVLVFVPRDSFSTYSRLAIGEYLAEALQGRVSAFTPFFPEGPLVRIHFIIGRDQGITPEYTDHQLEEKVSEILRSWGDHLKDELSSKFIFAKAVTLFSKYGKAFPVGYEELTSPKQALEDINHLETLNEKNPIAVNFYPEDKNKSNRCRVSIYHLNEPIPLSKRVPILENFGFAVIDERSFDIKPEGTEQDTINLYNMVLVAKDDIEFSLKEHTERLEQGFLAVWYDEAENDSYNQLILSLGTDWREVATIRALGAYLRQLGVPFTKRYIIETLTKHENITKDILSLFRLHCDPELSLSQEEKDTQKSELVDKIESDLSNIPSLDEDRILRHFRNMVVAILRTNFYQGKTGSAAERPNTISFKFNSAQIDAMPEPKPYREIFVYSPRVEGIHLRGGKIARGGLRWSDRRQDFRTEVLGLAKAQQVKNTVIVPTGAKGGFVPKNLPENGTREEIWEEGIACYKLFISSLLSVTDNIDGQDIIPPKDMLRHDEDDPYLVVAADKGTATFSDFANEISQSYNFWMDDAFASGGSTGYDHKKMAITARGAWESVKRHFREMDTDIQSEPFTVIGVGDMSGDVFGNGMLLSKAIKLIAAFDHRDIFIDPNPDPESTWQERKRLFDMGRSSWQDYDTSLISQGGGIFSRQAKSIELTDKIREITGLKRDQVTPNELINALLKSQVDLLWFGGIGTYICADDERDDEVGDRANDNIRIKASQLKVKVVGEGANLGMTHRARIQFALNGGRVNSDAIDNSAGVNSSDLEVNIKIALGSAMKANKLTGEARNDLLVEMKEEVAAACLRNNYLQSLTISLGKRRGLADMSFQQRLMRELEKIELLDRELEFLPSDAELSERFKQSHPLTRPELAVLLAYAKIELFNKLIASSIPDDKFLERELISYFPKTLYERFPQEIENHPLKREIIATQLTNTIINRGGSTMSIRLKEETGHNIENISYAFIATSAIFEVEDIYNEIDKLDNKISGDLQLELYSSVQTLLREQTTWFLRNIDLKASLTDIISTYQKGLEAFDKMSEAALDPNLIERINNKTAHFENGGVPTELANRISGLKRLSDGPDIVLIAGGIGASIEKTTQIYGQVSRYFEIFELREKANELHVEDHFDRVAINSALENISYSKRKITENILQNFANDNDSFESWLQTDAHLVTRVKNVLREILDLGDLSIAKLTVGSSQLRDLSK